MIHVTNFTKRYGSHEAVKNISFKVKEGAFFALLGPNGAGKSTTIETLATLKTIEEGTLKINGYTLGKDDALIRQSIGLVFQYSVLDKALTGRENLLLRGAFYNLEAHALQARIDALDAIIGFGDFLDQRVKTLSGGQRRKLDIARALIHEPKLLMLDEPTTGLDPKSRQDIWRLILELKKASNMTLLLTTHYMEEVKDADHVIILHKGVVVAEDTADNLRLNFAKDTLKLYPKPSCKAVLDTLNIPYTNTNETFKVEVNDAFEGHALVSELKDHLHSFELHKASLDDVFLNLTGETFEGGSHA